MTSRFSFPRRGEILQDSVYDSYGHVLKRPSIDTFYQVNFAFRNLRTWMSSQSEGSRSIGGNIGAIYRKMALMCSEAEIPGTSYLTTDVIGARQGITETFPTLRQFPPLNLTFYLDSQHEILEVFEKWMYFINPMSLSWERSETYTRLRYPEEYKEVINITKFERDFKKAKNYMISPARPADVPDYVPPRYPTETNMSSNYKSKMTTYKIINAWPTNMTSMRVNYGNSDLLKLSIQFAYDRYYTKFGISDNQVNVTRHQPQTAAKDVPTNDTQLPGFDSMNLGSDRSLGANDLSGTISNFA